MTKTGKFFLWLFWGAIILAAPMARAVVSVQSSVDRQQVGVGDVFTYTATVISTDNVEIQEPRPPDLDGFELLEKWEANSASQRLMQTPQGMEFISQRKKDFHYKLRATRAGRLSIGAFEIVVDGKTRTTQPLVLQVSKEPQAQAQAGRPQRPPMPPGFGFPGMDSLDEIDRAEEEIYRQLLQRRQQFAQRAEPKVRTLPINPNEAFFIQVEADKSEVYEGEQVTVSWYLYTQGQMETLDRAKFPDLRGFWKEIIEEVPTIQFSEEIVNGKVYRKALLAAHALFPFKAGTAIIDEYKIKSRVRMPTPGFGGFAMGKAYEYTKSSQRVPIKVKPLPLEGRPASFTGAVGVFEVNASVDSTTVVVNQPFSFRVRFEGNGNAKGIDLPAVPWPGGVEVYDTKSDSKFFKNGSSYKTFEVLLIPRQAGDLEIPSFAFSMFDPAKGRYETKQTAPIHLKVVDNPGGAPTTPNASNRLPTPTTPATGAAKPLPGTVLPDPVISYETAHVGGWSLNPFFWSGIFGAILLTLFGKARAEMGWGQRRRDLKDLMARRWKDIEQTLRSGDHRKVGIAMTNLFYLVLGEIAGGGQASEEIQKVLERIPPSLRRDFGAALLKEFENFQVLSFAPEGMLGEMKSPERLAAAVAEARKLLDQVVSRVSEKDDDKK